MGMVVFGWDQCGPHLGGHYDEDQMRGRIAELVAPLDPEAARAVVEAPDLEALAFGADAAIAVLQHHTVEGARWGWRDDGSLWLEPLD